MPKNTPSQENQQPAGSPSTGEPLFLVVGKLRHAHGLHGEILMEVITDFPERIRPGLTLYIGEEHQPLKVASRRPHSGNLLLGFHSIDTPEAIGQYRNLWAYVPASDRPPLEDGEYYHHQLLGITVVSDEGQVLGKLVEILTNPANDVYVVQPEAGREILLPALKSVILNVDLAQSRMQVHLLPGLLPE